jgi:sugar phosphate permease
MKAVTKIVVAIWALRIASYTDRTAIALAGPKIIGHLGLGPQPLGLNLSTFGIGYTLAQIPDGWIADRWSVRGLLAVSALCWAAMTGLTGLMIATAEFRAARLGGILAAALIGFLVAHTGNFGPGFAFMEVELLVAAAGAILLLREASRHPDTSFT